MNWYIHVLKNYAVFSGRARRTEYWMFTLISFLISIALGVIDGMTGAGESAGLLGSLYGLAVLIPSIAVTVRRLHDTGRSGWWCLIVLIPILGWIALLVFCVLDSNSDENEYGANPKLATA
ncbi:DUF805 domain-containing protein [Paraferrimonas sedimenticola]|uniref:DUF805 domain-containing protein n=1 Tax=Paraferrimonas sedimenticola TaxID=375674 RepID=A0AA37RVF5_9GAMM|nr:DUF805 domain-containing protein [Paraferrimonas sedimenticola]GLP95963.1 DUF805 domain-containing protein [Paraferrimonas sedimenticola]